jgi:hypothetical protein
MSHNSAEVGHGASGEEEARGFAKHFGKLGF